MNQIGDKINDFLEVDLKAHPEQVERFFERVQSNYDEAIRTATRFLLLMIATWFLTYAIHEGWIEKIDWLGFEFNRKMTIASPLLIGLLTYGLQSGLAGAVVLWEAISRRLRYMLPTAWKHNLDDMLAPPTFSNVERMLEPEVEFTPLSLCSRAWFVIVTLMIFGGSLAGLIHATVLLFRPPLVTNRVVIIISASLGFVAWIRGFVLSGSAINATGGFELCHHRGERTAPPPVKELPQNSPATSPAPSPSAPSSPEPSLQRQLSTMPPSVAAPLIYRQARVLDVRRTGVVIFVEREKKKRVRLSVRS